MQNLFTKLDISKAYEQLTFMMSKAESMSLLTSIDDYLFILNDGRVKCCHVGQIRRREQESQPQCSVFIPNLEKITKHKNRK